MKLEGISLVKLVEAWNGRGNAVLTTTAVPLLRLGSNSTHEDDATYSPSEASQLQEMNDAMFLELAPAVTFLAILLVTGILGNLAVCYIFAFKLRSSTQNLLLLWIGVFDLLSVTLGIPAEILDMKHYYLFVSESVCRVMRFLTSFPCLASIQVLLVIAADRYRKVCHPLHRQIGRAHAKWALGAIILLAWVFSEPALHIYGLHSFETSVPGLIGQECSVKDSQVGGLYPLVYEITLCVAFVVSATALIVIYSRIWLETRRHTHYLKRHAASAKQNSSSLVSTSKEVEALVNNRGPRNSASDASGGEEDCDDGTTRNTSANTHSTGGYHNISSVDSKRSHTIDGDLQCGEIDTLLHNTNRNSNNMKSAHDRTESSCILQVIDEDGQVVHHNTAEFSDPTALSIAKTSDKNSAHLTHKKLSSRERNAPTVFRVGCHDPRQEPTRKSMSNLDDLHASSNQNALWQTGIRLSAPLPGRYCTFCGAMAKKDSSSTTSTNSESLSGVACIVRDEELDNLQQSPANAAACSLSTLDTSKEDTKSVKTDDLVATKTSTHNGSKPSLSISELLSNARQAFKSQNSSQLHKSKSSPALTHSVSLNALGSRKVSQSQTLAPLQKSKSSQSLGMLRVRKALRPTRVTVIACAITTTFILSYLPHLVLIVLRSVLMDFEHNLDEVSMVFYNIFLRSYFVNNVINVFVYGTMSREFRDEASKLWHNIRHPILAWRRKKRETT